MCLPQGATTGWFKGRVTQLLLLALSQVPQLSGCWGRGLPWLWEQGRARVGGAVHGWPLQKCSAWEMVCD